MTHPDRIHATEDGQQEVLLVDGDAATATMSRAILERARFRVFHVCDIDAARDRLRQSSVACVVLDLAYSGRDGLLGPAAVALLRAAAPDVPVIALASQASLAAAVDVVRAGAFDYLVRPFGAARLLHTIGASLAGLPMGAPPSRVARPVADPVLDGASPAAEGSGFPGFVGCCQAMQVVFRTVEAAARSSASVFVTGESGTGKELVAEALHQRSARALRPLVAINCAAIPRDLLEGTLFGHVRGAFSGATSDVEGAAARADGSTLFLDEIGEMDLSLQSKLLRFVQTGSYHRVGDPRPRQADIRFVAATNRDPLEAVAEGRLREDLFYRLNVVHVHLPPLRDREGDGVLIARSFLQQCARQEGKAFGMLSSELEDQISSRPWPGNVRQLLNAIRSAVVLNDGPVLTISMLPQGVGPYAAPVPARLAAPPAAGSWAGASPTAAGFDGVPAGLPAGAPIASLLAAERSYIEWVISRCDGNLQAAARKLGISPSTIYRKREAWTRREAADGLRERGAWIRGAGAPTLPASGVRQRGHSLSVPSSACG